MADEQELHAIDAETTTMLEEHVKKGKARKFILISKGASIQTLIVFKKGPYGPKLNQAKKSGFRGQSCCGVVTGKGVSITFQIPGTPEVSSAMKAEGNVYEGEPCKVAKLRKFLVEEAGLKFKPEFAVITQLADLATVNESDEETDAGPNAIAEGPPSNDQTAGQSSETEASETEASETEASETEASETEASETESSEAKAPSSANAELKQKLIAALKNLAPKIQEAITAAPQRRQEVLAPIASIKDHLKQERLAEAKQEILLIPPLLKEILSSVPPAAPPLPPDTPAEPTPNQELVQQWGQLLKQLTPKLKQVISNQQGDFRQAATLFKQAQSEKPTSLAQALETLTKCSTLVEQIVGAPPAATETSTTAATETIANSEYLELWQSVSAEFKGQRSRVVGALSEASVGEFDALLQRAEQEATRGEYLQATNLAIQAAEYDAEARRTTVSAEVQRLTEGFRGALLRWNKVLLEVTSELNQLQTVMVEKSPEAVELAAGLNGLLDQFQVGLDDVLATGMRSSDEATQKECHQQASQIILEFQNMAQSSALLDHIDNCPFLPVDIGGRITRALDELQVQLAS